MNFECNAQTGGAGETRRTPEDEAHGVRDRRIQATDLLGRNDREGLKE
ncbi:MAG: hypothetical protein ACFCUJ_06365 [Thiotrichales bacterium]